MNEEFKNEAIDKYVANLTSDIDDLAEKLVVSKYVIACALNIKDVVEFSDDIDKLISDLRSYVNKYIYHF